MKSSVTLFPVLSLAVLLLASSGCQQYGEISPKAYEISKALYSACNRKSTEHLAEVARVVQESVDAGELSAEEKSWFDDIIRTAENGDWQEAMLDARAMMEEQQN